MKRALSQLTNDERTIKYLTEVAAIGQYEKGREVVEVIINNDTPSALGKLFLIDSIIRNVGGLYVDLFAKEFVPSFRCVFLNADDEVRTKLLQLRNRWTGTVAQDVLNSLDLEINKIEATDNVTIF